MTLGPQQTTTNSSTKFNSQKSQVFQWFQDTSSLCVAHVLLQELLLGKLLQVLLLGIVSAQRFFT